MKKANTKQLTISIICVFALVLLLTSLIVFNVFAQSKYVAEVNLVKYENYVDANRRIQPRRNCFFHYNAGNLHSVLGLFGGSQSERKGTKQTECKHLIRRGVFEKITAA